MSWLDRAIGWLSPAAGLRRQRYRHAMHVMARSYEGAKVGRRTDGWRAPGSDANAAIGPALARLRARSRDLTRNNPYAAKAALVFRSNAVGDGILPRSRTGDEALDQRVDALWAEWAEAADLDGMTDVYGLQQLIVSTIAESGEALIRPVIPPDADRLPLPMQLQVLEGDHVDTTRDGLVDGARVRLGVQLDGLGRPTGYWLLPEHPGSQAAPMIGRRGQSVLVPRDRARLVFERARPGQLRGVPAVAPLLIRLRDLDEYDDAEVVRKKIEACFAAFVIGDDEDATLGTTSVDQQGRRVESFEPGMIARMPGATDVKFSAPAASGGYAEFHRQQLHAVAAGYGLTYELVTGDLSQVNYSSYRAGALEFRRRIAQFQWHCLAPGALDPVWGWFIDAAIAGGRLPERAYPVEYAMPRWESVDPLKEAQADLLRLRLGLDSWPARVAREGWDPDKVLQEIASHNAALDRLNIVLDSDPRRTSRVGGGQAPIEEERELVADLDGLPAPLPRANGHAP